MNKVDMDGLTPDTRAAWDELVVAARARGADLVPRSARRTCAEQAEQYAIGRQANDTRAVVTRAKGCRSWHVLGRAVDFYVVIGGKQSALSSDYTNIGKLAESLGWVWGGRFDGFGPNGDEGHVEWHPGLTTEQACPNPDACVDVVPTKPSLLGGGSWLRGWGGLLLGTVVVAGAAGAGVVAAKRYAK